MPPAAIQMVNSVISDVSHKQLCKQGVRSWQRVAEERRNPGKAALFLSHFKIAQLRSSQIQSAGWSLHTRELLTPCQCTCELGVHGPLYLAPLLC